MSRHSDRSSKNEVKSVCHPDERSDEACLPTVEHLQVGRDLAFRFFGRPMASLRMTKVVFRNSPISFRNVRQ